MNNINFVRYLSRSSLLAIISLLLVSSAVRAEDGGYVWVEGEHPDHGEGNSHSWYSGSVNSNKLSGGDFVSSFTASGPTVVAFDVNVPEQGTYALWIRANPVKSRISWRKDGGKWTKVNTAKAVDKVNIADDGSPDLRYLGWLNMGELTLDRGTTTFGFKFHSKNKNHGSLDCFVLTRVPFQPDGKSKPGQVLSQSEPGYFAFDAPADRFTDASAFDLRRFNEETAGQSGPVQQDGGRIRLGNGTPVRFWGAVGGVADSRSGQAYLARRLAKAGFNAVRIHSNIADRSDDDPTSINRGKLDDWFYAIKTFRENGIYTNLSFHFYLGLKIKKSDNTLGEPGSKPTALLFLDGQYRKMWKSWARKLLTSENPYTGMTLAEDPSVGFFEIHNEDSLFFHTFKEDNVGPRAWKAFEKRYATWLKEKYDSYGDAQDAWNGVTHKHDRWKKGRMGLYSAWFMTSDALNQDRFSDRKERIKDQVAFLAQKQRSTYRELTEYVKRELGFRGLVVPSNWTTADNGRLLGIERWSYTAGDVIDRHGYYSGSHKGNASGYSVRKGHTFENVSALKEPSGAPLGYMQIAGRPGIQSEIAWNEPNKLDADGVPLISSYGALQGVDGVFLFATKSGQWDTNSTGKWALMRPSHYGQSVAGALQYRRGDVSDDQVAVRQVLKSSDQFDLASGGIIEGENSDFRIKEHDQASDPANQSAFDPLSYFTGRVERVFTDVKGAPENVEPKTADLDQYIDRDGKVIKSMSGELLWDYGSGLHTVDTDRSQMATGYLNQAGTIELGDVTIRCHNEYGTIHVISLDGQPIRESDRILIQAFTREKLYGFETNGNKISSLGSAPINVRKIDAAVTFRNMDGLTAEKLNPNGYPEGSVRVNNGTIFLPENHMYTSVRR